ncbi:ribonuclease HII [Aurantimicrobium minutum]|uniref:ribonuclease HII n=1 Tax=Aurantimicrobium minutum TaxID=708131 RepID=UPI002473D3D9|nr:ribonuclease HII [Aurantimicrobium minutum]MDH6533177.1 ribonuclease HII [Aurantimicrobium minutum]
MPAEPTLAVEQEMFASGIPLIIGIDEVGRGAMAGPVMVGVCALGPGVNSFPQGLRDSKLVSEKKRLALFPEVQQWAPTAVGEASAGEIDELGITACLGLAARRALIELHEAGVQVGTATVLLDGSHNWLNPALAQPLPVVTRVKADQDCAVVSAASIVAKVTRDRLMMELDSTHPEYGWASNKGYGAAVHMDAIKTVGLTPHHRASWVK